MSNSRLDDFYFVLFLFFLYLLFTTHTIIAFVPLRSLVVLNFPPARWRKKRVEEKETYTYRFLVTTQTLLIRKKNRHKKMPARLRVFRRAINWSASLCSSCHQKERESRSELGTTVVSAVCTSIPLPGVTRVDELRIAREGSDGLKGAWEDGH